ncbi:CgeB family protein [Candidatus Contubernalis alkaliaceticus]|uniref:CgeB family protein n=1 Tax=Candidatus Contubernalis alkaliaceticus TaxID=338645 RepID=UPI001F4BD5D7|nr:glycosyltransferase [Candidatus Contubernalis alkalaceticus]UNC92301.1 glycosyltransferase [Candidatus Contubernalis alkalaceticus]
MQKYKIFMLDHRSYCINSLGDSLAQLGHKIYFQSSWSPQEVEKGIAYFKPKILITVGFNRKLFGGFLDLLPGLCHKYQLFHIYWATEDLINHTDWSLQAVQRAKPDLIWTIHPSCVAKYEKLGISASYLNFACNPRVFLPKKSKQKKKYNISLVGSTHFFKETYRFESLRHLLFPLVRENIKTHIWGIGWRKQQSYIKKEFGETIPDGWLHGHLAYKKSAGVYRSSKVVLGIQNAEDQVTQRTFEILGTGAFMIASRTKAIKELFTNKEVVLTSCPQETVELVTYYLNRPDLRQYIGNNARRKILKSHTYVQRLREVWPMAESLLN